MQGIGVSTVSARHPHVDSMTDGQAAGERFLMAGCSVLFCSARTVATLRHELGSRQLPARYMTGDTACSTIT